MTSDDYPELSYLLSAYFHQDWQDVYSTVSGALCCALEHEQPALIRQICSEIDLLLKIDLDDADLGSFMYSKLGCYLNPAGLGFSNADWLRQVESELKAMQRGCS